MHSVLSSNPISSPAFCTHRSYFNPINPSPCRRLSNICCTINIDTQKIKRLLNSKSNGMKNPPSKKSQHTPRLRRKNFRRNDNSNARPQDDVVFAEDSPFKAAFVDYIEAMDSIKHAREHLGNEEEIQPLMKEENCSLENKSERRNRKVGVEMEQFGMEVKRKVRFRELNHKNFKPHFVSNADLCFKPKKFSVSRDRMSEFVKDSVDLNAKVGLRVNVERGVKAKSGEVNIQEKEKSATGNKEHGRVGDAEIKAFQFCTNTGPRVNSEVRIRQLAEKLNDPHTNMSIWTLSELMYSSKIKFTDRFMNHLIQDLGDMGNWRRALQIIEWLHSRERYESFNRRYIYTTVLSILGKAGRPVEALNLFHAMRQEFSTYPDIPAYHSIAVTLGQAGFIKELLDIMDCMQAGPDKKLENVPLQNWNPCLKPDLVIYNSLINACVAHKEWQGAIWTLQQIRHSGIKPSSATYGLVMEVMLTSAKYDLVHDIFEKVGMSGMIPNALTYRALVKACRKESKIDEAVVRIEEMERRGIVGTASVYYDLACCLCSAGRSQDALLQVAKIQKVAKKPLYVTYTGLIKACIESGYLQDSISIFDHMQKFCTPNIITCNMMLKLYAQNHMFRDAKSLFEGIKKGRISPQNASDNGPLITPDIITYHSMLEACVVAQEWDYFENVYQDMLLKGYQVNNKQYAFLIVAASRAGKVHLLKNAYEQLINLGKTPHVSLYKELICQNIHAGDYAKTLAYASSMAYAKLNVRSSEWMELFEKNPYRISKENLQGLLNMVNNSNLLNGQTNIIIKNFINCIQLWNEQWA